MTISKKALIDAMRDLNDDAEIHILCTLFDTGTDGYADDICFKDKVTGDDVVNELTIVACFF